jgi:predicted CoA-substrate-specific enzyme activase
VGSTTIKLVVLDARDRAGFSLYQRHFSDVRRTMVEMILAAAEEFPDQDATLAVTGSAGISAAGWLGAEFIQEVVAGAGAIGRFLPDVDVAIELGGEDAKLTFFDSGVDQRMNETCAGGTGAFIDQMATFLKTDPAGLNDLAKSARTIHPIAARCGVFAKADILPLLNEGASREDIAASIFQAVVDQTIGGLACGRAIRGRVAFLGGPLFFLSELRLRFTETLKLPPDQALCPPDAQYYVALGAALGSRTLAPAPFSHWAEKARALAAADLPPEIDPLPPLFQDLGELAAFQARHDAAHLPRADWPEEGGIFVGLDAGSTTTKLVALDRKGCLLHSFYGHSSGNPLKSAVRALTELYDLMPDRLTVLRSGVTGYGEGLIRAALGVDLGEVETVAHTTAAAFFQPEVSFIVDIGGQDIKCLSIKNGVIDRLMLNEACSSGCGSFLETFARTLELDAAAFAQTALSARRPVDLGSRCTVFMNSKVKQAQKEGAPVGDISAGLSYSVVRNALYKVIRLSRPEDLGDRVVVQGGTFLNDAVLRAFELSIGREVVRPDIAGLMGAFGMARLAQESWREDEGRSTLLDRHRLSSFSVSAKNTRCRKCENNCLLTVNRFSDGRAFISGNRCERGAALKSPAADKLDALAHKAHLGDISPRLARIPALGALMKSPPTQFAELPNLFQWNRYRLFEVYRPLAPGEARATVGLPRALGLYDNYPFWFTLFHNLGLRVELSPPSSKELFNSALETIPSQTVCYPAKLVHGHMKALAERRPDFIFFPCLPLDLPADYATDARYNCPLVGTYGELIRLNMDILREDGVRFISPFLDLSSPARAQRRLAEELSFLRISGSRLGAALKAAYRELAQYRADIHSAGERALSYLERHGGTGIILAGHPYHLDPEIHHGIAEVIAMSGLAVLTCDSVDHLAPSGWSGRVVDQWIPHSRLYRAALTAAARDNLELVQLGSFGCGLDAVTTDQVGDILEEAGKVYTFLKIDEGANLGAARIRIRSLLAAIRDRRRRRTPNSTGRVYNYRPSRPDPESHKDYTILAPQMSPLHWRFLAPALAGSGYRLEVLPQVSREAVEEGLRHVNNDACYPALMAIGQILSALKSGAYDLSRTAVLMSQTGGGCRATNYVGFLRRALERAGLGQVPVWPLALGARPGGEGLKLDRHLFKRLLLGLLYGDMLNRLLLASRPYEKQPGAAQALADRWSAKAAETVRRGDRGAFKRDMAALVEDFAALDLAPPDRPKVALVGEILLNFHPEANNRAVEVVEAEGGQAVLPELTDFILYCLYDDVFRADKMAGGRLKKWLALGLIRLVESYRKPLRRALARHPRFGPINPFRRIVKAGEKIVSLGNQSGEGWYLTADMALMIEKGVPNILCLQPFGCLPNHITGKGVVKELKRRYPEANLAAVDYDPGASEVNQLNRIKLMMTVARKAAEFQPPAPGGPGHPAH